MNLEREGLDVNHHPPPPHTVLISHPQTSRLTDGVWGGEHWGQGGRVTDSDGGGRVRVGG
jgi:hypothetical protein